MYEFIKNLNREGIAIIMITHDLNAALQYCSHVLHVGKKTYFGTREEYLESGVGRLFLAQEGQGE